MARAEQRPLKVDGKLVDGTDGKKNGSCLGDLLLGGSSQDGRKWLGSPLFTSHEWPFIRGITPI